MDGSLRKPGSPMPGRGSRLRCTRQQRRRVGFFLPHICHLRSELADGQYDVATGLESVVDSLQREIGSHGCNGGHVKGG